MELNSGLDRWEIVRMELNEAWISRGLSGWNEMGAWIGGRIVRMELNWGLDRWEDCQDGTKRGLG